METSRAVVSSCRQIMMDQSPQEIIQNKSSSGGGGGAEDGDDHMKRLIRSFLPTVPDAVRLAPKLMVFDADWRVWRQEGDYRRLISTNYQDTFTAPAGIRIDLRFESVFIPDDYQTRSTMFVTVDGFDGIAEVVICKYNTDADNDEVQRCEQCEEERRCWHCMGYETDDSYGHAHKVEVEIMTRQTIPFNRFNQYFDLPCHKTLDLPPLTCTSFDISRWPGCIHVNWYGDDEEGFSHDKHDKFVKQLVDGSWVLVRTRDSKATSQGSNLLEPSCSYGLCFLSAQDMNEMWKEAENLGTIDMKGGAISIRKLTEATDGDY